MVSDVPNGKKIPSELKTKLERHGQMVGVSREGWGWVKIPPMLLLMQCPWLCLSFPIVKVGAICLCWEKGVAGWHWGFGYPHVQRPVPETSLDKPVPGRGGCSPAGLLCQDMETGGRRCPLGLVHGRSHERGFLCQKCCSGIRDLARDLQEAHGGGKAGPGAVLPAPACLPAYSVPVGQAGGMGSRAQGLAPEWVLHGKGRPWGKDWTLACFLPRDVPPRAGFFHFYTASAEAGSGLYAATHMGRRGPWEIWGVSRSSVGQSRAGRWERPSGGGCCAAVRSNRREGMDPGCCGIQGGSHEGMRVPWLGRLATRPL